MPVEEGVLTKLLYRATRSLLTTPQSTRNAMASYFTVSYTGHAVHDVMAYKHGYLQFHPPLTLAETASIFGEMIVFRDLLKMAESPAERLSLLMTKIDAVINSVVRQCSFDRFEELAHTARKEGELNTDELDKYWMQAVEEYYGKLADADTPFDTYEDMDHLWAYVPHFHHVPFYVYSYAFADLVGQFCSPTAVELCFDDSGADIFHSLCYFGSRYALPQFPNDSRWI